MGKQLLLSSFYNSSLLISTQPTQLEIACIQLFSDKHS